jgi:hypothetical protein
MSTYYLVNDHAIWPLGETSFKKFYAEDGWNILEVLIKNNEEKLLETMYIRRDDTSDKMSIEEFLDEIEKYQILLDKE